MLARVGSQNIAAGLFLRSRDTVYYKYSVADPSYLNEKRPNHLLTWCAIRSACLDGYGKFDFGRTLLANEGLSRHKEMWGAQKLELLYSFHPRVSGITMIVDSGPMFNIMTNIWRRMPNS